MGSQWPPPYLGKIYCKSWLGSIKWPPKAVKAHRHELRFTASTLLPISHSAHIMLYSYCQQKFMRIKLQIQIEIEIHKCNVQTSNTPLHILYSAAKLLPRPSVAHFKILPQTASNSHWFVFFLRFGELHCICNVFLHQCFLWGRGGITTFCLGGGGGCNKSTIFYFVYIISQVK